MPRTYKSVNQLIEQGYRISESNVQYAGEAWEIVDPLLTEFETAFEALRTAQALCQTTRIDKEAAVEKAKLAREAMEHSLVRLKRFIGVVADEDFAEVMIHELGIDANFPDKDEDFVTLIMSSVIPRLDNWDGTPQEIVAAIKTEVNNAIVVFRTAVLDSADKQSEAETATADRDENQEAYEDVLTKIRKWLYLMLPNEREDQRLEEYGFEAWGGEEPEPEEPLIPWPGPAPIEGEDLGDGMVELRVKLIEDMVYGFWEGREAPNGPWEVLIQHILFDEGLPVAHRELNVPTGKYEYRFTPVNAELAHGLPSMVIVMVK